MSISSPSLNSPAITPAPLSRVSVSKRRCAGRRGISPVWRGRGCASAFSCGGKTPASPAFTRPPSNPIRIEVGYTPLHFAAASGNGYWAYVRKVMSWDDGFLGARASRPPKACHSPGHLPHLDQPGMAPWLSFGLADPVAADRVAACSIALKLSRGQRDRMRAGRPRSQAMPWGVSGGRLLRKPTCTPVGNRMVTGVFDKVLCMIVSFT